MLSANPVSQSRYISMALSDDNKMGDDLVFACSPVFNSIKTSWNIGYENSNQVSGIKITNILISNTESNLLCSFSISASFYLTGSTTKSFDLSNIKYFLLTAEGANQDGSTIGMHDSWSTSDSAVMMNIVGVISKGKPNLFLQIHGALMVIAWMGCAPVGMLVAIHFKPVCSNIRPLGLSFWLFSHQITTYSAALLTIFGLIFSYVAVGTKGLSLTSLQVNAHSAVGLLTCILTFAQVVFAFFRPKPGSYLK